MLRAEGLRGRRAFRGGMVRWERKGERAPNFSGRRRFERKRAEITLQAASRFLSSWEEVRRVYRVYIKAVIGRRDLGVRLRPIGAYTPVGIIDMGLGV